MPYAFDPFMAVLLLLPAVHWLHAPGRFRWLASLTLATPFVIFGSYPAAFVGGGVSLAPVPSARRHGWKSRLLWGLFNVALVGASSETPTCSSKVRARIPEVVSGKGERRGASPPVPSSSAG
jgi:hypothetical protein